MARMLTRLYITGILICMATLAFSQGKSYTASLSGQLTDAKGKPVPGADIFIENSSFFVNTDAKGYFQLSGLPVGNSIIKAYKSGYNTISKVVDIKPGKNTLTLSMDELSAELQEVEVRAQKEETFGIARLNTVEGAAIYESKKSEVIVMDDIIANKSTNNARQVFSRVPGLNIWENDGAGIQLGIGGRGLSPNRTSNFNTRQNGYDISADALGYPESYYTPPTEALERIEIVRGAASLQYGPQFGGMLNFKFKRGPKNKPIEATLRQTVGAYGYFGSFNSIGGTVKKVNYYGFYQRKQGNGWRDNSGFQMNTAYASAYFNPHSKVEIGVEYTHMNYVAQQPGGLTMRQFEENPQQSFRDRNWFKVDWNVLAVTADWKISEKTKLNSRMFGVYSKRQSLGNLKPINRPDLGGERTLIYGEYQNWGNETRLIHRYNLMGKMGTLLTGVRYYQGLTIMRQGQGTETSSADFYFKDPNNLQSDFDFPSQNISLFAENVYFLSDKWSITPGLRYEFIKTQMDGQYVQTTVNGAGDIRGQLVTRENSTTPRSVFLLGLGTSFRPSEEVELYANISQNYRSITFSDLRISNPNKAVDENLRDESGYNADIGVRGNISKAISFDVSAFYLYYYGRIGSLNTVDPVLFNNIRLTTNVADSRTYGVEAYAEADFLKLFMEDPKHTKLRLFTNFAVINALYVNTKNTAVLNKKVENVPPINVRVGSNFSYKKFDATIQYSYTKEHYSDATNTLESPTAVNGIIPTYQIVDFSAGYTYKMFRLEASVNNLTNRMYFTRRADGYPGPGILPSDGRTFYLTLQVKI